MGVFVGEAANGRELYDLLGQGMSSQLESSEIRAAALTADVNIPAAYEPAFPDGIRILLESKSYAQLVYVPYRLEKPTLTDRLLRRRRRVEYGPSFAVDKPMVSRERTTSL